MCMTKAMATLQLQQLFQACDTDGSGYLERQELQDLCARFDISQYDADVIFDDLDHDGDGRINFEDFSSGLADFLSNNCHLPTNGATAPEVVITTAETSSRPSSKRAPKGKEKTVQRAWQNLTTEMGKAGNFINEEVIIDLYKELQSSVKPHLVKSVETVIEDLLENIGRLQDENKQLEKSWKREKEQHEKHLHILEEEMDNQVKEVELRVKQQAEEQVEAERRSWQLKMDAEMDEMQAHISMFEKMNNIMQNPACPKEEERMKDLRDKLETAVSENRQLRTSLIDTQTNILLMRNEISQLRSQYDEKFHSLTREREQMMDAIQDQDHFSRQIKMLQEANKHLQDTNDCLRLEVEKKSRQVPAPPRVQEKRGSVMSDYLQREEQHWKLERYIAESEDVCVAGKDWRHSSLTRPRLQTMPENGAEYRMQLFVESLEKCDSSPSISGPHDQSDSGLSTLRDPIEGGSDEGEDLTSNHRPPFLKSEGSSPEGRCSPDREDRSLQSAHSNDSRQSGSSSDRSRGNQENDFPSRKLADIKRQLGMDANVASYSRSRRPRLNSAPVPLPRHSLKHQSEPRSPRTVTKTNSTDSEVTTASLCSTPSSKFEEDFEPTGPPQKTYKIIFVGDVAVGKSSFIIRMSTGTFTTQTSSTLGIDFQTKVLKVDGMNFALQLWDTAGQERFRSITQSYFRKADGIMMLYDCTSEYTFLNVRQWMDAVNDATVKYLPVMLVGNKTDLRSVAQDEGRSCVTTEQGEKLAQEYGALFIETSAKSGCNITEAVVKLTRIIIGKDDDDNVSVAVQLDKPSPKKGSCCMSTPGRSSQPLTTTSGTETMKIGPSGESDTTTITTSPVSIQVEDESETEQPQKTYKIIFLGDLSVGKSSFILRMSKDVFASQLSSAVGVDYQTVVVQIDGVSVGIQLWDTAGQERFQSITRSYFRKADGIMMLYDCTNEHTFLNVRQWMNTVNTSEDKYVPVMLIANKTDLREQSLDNGLTCISTGEGEQLAREYAALFAESSAKTGNNVAAAVMKLIRTVIALDKEENLPPDLQLDQSSTTSSSQCQS